MRVSSLIITALACLYGIIASDVSAEETGRRPNILVIMADDLSPHDISTYGGPIATPHLDKMASEGTVFETAFATPVCGPSRILIMTGRYGSQTRHYNMGDRPGAPSTYDPPLDFTDTEVTFGNILRDGGYRTAIAGKWQLTTPLHVKANLAGFSESLLWRIGYREGFGDRERNPNGIGNAGSRYFHPSLVRNGEGVRTKADDFGPDMFTDFLLETITADADTPWLAYYPMALPHGPLGPTPDAPDISYTDSRAGFQAYVEYMDKMVGKLIDGIDAAGQRENTLIIFTTDNATDARWKNQPSANGAHVPLIMRWPGTIRENHRSKQLIDFSNILPTVVEAAQLELPSDREYIGQSVLPYLRGETENTRDWIFSYLGQFRILMTQDWLLEYESVDYKGDFYDLRSGERIDVTHSEDPEVLAAREHFASILKKLPAPELPPSERLRFIQYLERYNMPGYDLTRVYPEEYRGMSREELAQINDVTRGNNREE